MTGPQSLCVQCLFWRWRPKQHTDPDPQFCFSANGEDKEGRGPSNYRSHRVSGAAVVVVVVVAGGGGGGGGGGDGDGGGCGGAACRPHLPHSRSSKLAAYLQEEAQPDSSIF